MSLASLASILASACSLPAADDQVECVEPLSEFDGGYSTLDEVYADPPRCSTLIACTDGGYLLRGGDWAYGAYGYYDSDGNLITFDPYTDAVVDDCTEWTDRYGPAASCEAACLIEHFEGCHGWHDDANYTDKWEPCDSGEP